ncbi:hypothetical protein ACIQUM_07480 [Amycolatopsis azurea]|uniref:hypothetical protein n=1 Tax=Amycolatopsis azurea TaxID=36819 RepID=UPI003812A7C5
MPRQNAIGSHHHAGESDLAEPKGSCSMNTAVDADLLNRVLTNHLGRAAAESIITALDNATTGDIHGNAETVAATGRQVGTVGKRGNDDRSRSCCST